MPFPRSIHPGKASPTRYNKQEQESWGISDYREGKEKRVELTKEKAAETVDEGRKALVGGDARRHARDLAAPGRHLAPPFARLLHRQSRLASRLLLASRRRELTVGFEPKGGRRGLELYVWVGLRNPTDMFPFLRVESKRTL
jgi:hypothetical protein